jgi:hypothetical protein
MRLESCAGAAAQVTFSTRARGLLRGILGAVKSTPLQLPRAPPSNLTAVEMG